MIARLLIVALLAAGIFYYACRVRHPTRTRLNAFWEFSGWLCGVTLAATLVAVLLYALLPLPFTIDGLMYHALPWIFFLAALAIAFVYADRAIRKPLVRRR